ncbi:YciI family protein [Nonomuraea turcica]|uniref:hypothetical protein n=1 Tax=Nonomuraea sp. G32 TaxID=3067274 RepID=UPI00273BF8C3|nr:hypothetical protein [Nonomuraea sp. G32]MDP4506305.1 hypothetical protein [Nonomuraea sp. G32]
MARYVVQLAFDGDPRRLTARPAHREHLRRLKEEGRLVSGRRSCDRPGPARCLGRAGAGGQ